MANDTGEPSAPRADVAVETPAAPERRRFDLVLALTIVGGAFLRFWHIGTQSIWYDEYSTTLVTNHRLAEMVIAVLPHTEGSPPLYYVMQWLWLPIAGRGDGAVRSLAALIGIATIPMVYVAARELRQSRRVARTIALIVAVNPMLVWYSQEARPYSLLALMGAVTIYFWARALNHDRKSDFLWWGFAAAAAMCTHYFAIFLVVPELAWLLSRRRGRMKEVLQGSIPLAVVLVPLAVLALAQKGKNQAWISDFPLELRFSEMGRHLLLGPAEPFDTWAPLGFLFVVLAIVLVVRRGDAQERSTAGTLVALGLSGFVLALIATVLGSDYILGRNMLASIIPLLVALSIGLGARRSGWIGIVATAILCIASIVVVFKVADDPTLQKPSWRETAAVLRTGGPQRAVIVDAYLGSPLLRYIDGADVLNSKKRKVPVKRIDLLYHIPAPGHRCGRWSGLACEAFFFPHLSKSLEKKFPLVDRVEVAGFIVNRYEAAKPIRLSKRQLIGRTDDKHDFVLFPNGLPKVHHRAKDRNDS